MTGRVLLAVLLGGIAAGLIMGVIQHVRLTPLILAAETYEFAGGHSHGAASATEAPADASDAPAEEWAPADGIERSFYTTVSTMLTGAGLAIALAGLSFVAGIPLTARNGAIWGLCGFLAASLAPAAGLPPELPGMPAAELGTRQSWWLFTIVATGLGLYLIACRRAPWSLAIAVLLIALPHAVGAPLPTSRETAVPAGLAAQFTANSLAAGAIFWSLIGLFTGLALDRHGKGVTAT